MLEKKEREKFEKLLTGSEKDRMLLGATLIPKIKNRMECAGLLDFIQVNPIKAGAIHSKVKKMGNCSAAIDESGTNVETTTTGNRIFPAEFILSSNLEIPIMDITQRCYNLSNRIVNEVASEFVRKLEKLWYQLLRQSAINSDQYLKYSTKDKFLLNSKFFSKNNTVEFIKKGIIHTTGEEEHYLAVNRNLYGKIFALSKHFGKTSKELFNATVVTRIDISKSPVESPPIVPDNILICFPKTPVIDMDVRVDMSAFKADQFTVGKAAYGFLFCQIQSLCIPDCSKVSMIELPE